MPEDDQSHFDQLIEEARLAHRRRVEDKRFHKGASQSFATDAMKAPGLVAAAGIAAVLGFYSANYNHLALIPGKLSAFNSILFWLFLSLLLTVIAQA